MWVGVLFALAACFVWGGIFIIPTFQLGYNPLEIIIARYFIFGILSAIVALFRFKEFIENLSSRVISTALFYALISNILYFVSVVVALRLATPPVTVLTLGLVPIVVAFYGNWEMRECQFRCLVWPALGIIFGMLLINFMAIDWTFQTYTPQSYLLGLGCAFWALLSWSWYAVKNARFLKKNPAVSAGNWATLLGLATLFWAVIIAGSVSLGWHRSIEWGKYITPSRQWMVYIIGSLVLGIVCSWVGTFFWNRASTYLPMSVAGPMIIFETIFALTFVFLIQKRLPSLIEMIGVVSMLVGIIYIMLQVRKSRIEG